jgi:GTPase involved in cell partitioning and DNA repair
MKIHFRESEFIEKADVYVMLSMLQMKHELELLGELHRLMKELASYQMPDELVGVYKVDRKQKKRINRIAESLNKSNQRVDLTR